MPGSFFLSGTDKLRTFASGLVVPFCYFLEGGRKGNNFFPSVQGGRYFSSSFAGKKILFQPMFSLKKLRFLLELILRKSLSNFCY